MKVDFTAEELKFIQYSLDDRGDKLREIGEKTASNLYYDLAEKVHQMRYPQKGKLVTDNKGQYEFISNNGVRYSLYEPMTINKDGETNYASDMIVIFCDRYEDVPPRFVTYIYGAGYIDSLENDIKSDIDIFEKSNVDFIEEVKKAKEF